ncbi:flagellar protein FlaD [Methanohalophilus levihalophilus]|uniref:FlaD/FlaE family flagellar protein n=1 Tax=Methanohalophilus levihalophilus TaxID=1431282 RepID=UPI001FDA05F7|nr:FlaD/FlaE family flagellar protein [Methanohalophilus levihalophilus]MBP2029978.1 flagellar protein FlaD [Methanohalophilus levihalophilus]
MLYVYKAVCLSKFSVKAMAGISDRFKDLSTKLFKKSGSSVTDSASGGEDPFGENNFGDPDSPFEGDPFNDTLDDTAEDNEREEQNNFLEETSQRMDALDSRISKIDVVISMVQKENQEVKETVEKIDQSVLDLLSLYEIVSNQVNPFVGDDPTSKAVIERFDQNEKRIGELTTLAKMLKSEIEGFEHREVATELSAEAKQQFEDIEQKMEVFADAMINLHEKIEDLNSTLADIANRSEQLETSMKGWEKKAENTTLTAVRKKTVDKAQGSSQPSASDEEIEENESDEKLPLLMLASIKKNPMNIVVLLNWIEFLMERVGRNNLMDALDYYVDIGWVSEEVRSEIMAYARGIDYYVEKPTWRLLPEDHTKSLLFIERLRGKKIDKNQLSTIDREMAKVKHGLEELYGI